MSGRRHRRRSKPSGPPSALVKIFSDCLDDDWVDIANELCICLDLPDLTTRSGLRKVHSDLPAVKNRLNKAYEYASRRQNFNVMGAVLSIYAKICVLDAILQDKLIEAGFMEQVVFLLDVPQMRELALRILNAISLHVGKKSSGGIAKHTPALIRILTQNEDDPVITSLIAAIFSHSFRFDVVRKKAADMVNAVLDVLHKPIFTDYMFDHASSLIIDSIPALYNDKRRSPSMLTFFAALLRSEDLRRRVVALRCIMLLCSPEEEEEHSSDPDLQPFAFVTALKYRSLPSDLAEFADTYGRERCEIFAIDRCHDDYVAMHIQHSIDPDLVKFGRELAAQVLLSQYALPQSLCPCCYHVTADLKAEDGWEDILTRCATALRDNPKSVHSDEDLADVLEWNYLSMRRSKTAHTFAQAAMARNPSFGYFYYASSCSADTSSEKLRIVKKGLKCKELAPWLRAEFLRRAVHSAMFIGVMLQVAKNEAAAHLFSAYQDAKMLLKASPPDSVHRQQDVDIYILLTLVIEGPKIELTSGVIQSALKELEINDKFMEFINRPTKSTDMLRMLESRKAVVDRLPEALAEWSAMLQRADAIMQGGSRNMTLPEPAQKGDTQTLNSWLSNFEDELEKKEHCDDKDDEDGEPSFSELFEEDELALMRCSWCFRPSVVLKKCGRCGIPRYCDSECQKNHWKEHKIVCGLDMEFDLRQDDVATLSDSVHIMPS